jgi:glucose/arabinose dehydrogenase
VNFSTQTNGAAPDHRSFVVENFTSSPSCSASPQKLNNVLIIDQPQGNHNGGDLVFDANENLYISLGDGGSSNDVGPGHGFNGNGRNNSNVLGTILRIDPLGSSNGNNYSIPTDNPFDSGGSEVEEIYAYGFRNPYRMSFDAANGDLYTADVGQGDVEEIDKVVVGGNYGWNWKEGSFFFYNPQGRTYVSDVEPPNLPGDLIDPVGEYDHDEGISITGGFVYRGSAIPSLVGKYVFGDFSGQDFSAASGRLFYLDLQSQKITEFNICPSVPGYIFGFGQDSNNELYVLTNDKFNPSGVEGKLLKIVNPVAEEDLPSQCQGSDEFCLPIKSRSGSIALICL